MHLKQIVIASLAFSVALPVAAAEDPLPVELTAFAVDLGNQGRARTGTIQIRIDRWSTDEERTALRDTLIEGGSDDLLKALQKMKPSAGSIRTSDSLGWDIRYARQFELPGGGRRIVFATDRPMNFWEIANSARSADYEFMVGEVRVDAEGKGEGKLVTRGKVKFNKESRTIEIENYGTEPVRLNKVRVEHTKSD